MIPAPWLGRYSVTQSAYSKGAAGPAWKLFPTPVCITWIRRGYELECRARAGCFRFRLMQEGAKKNAVLWLWYMLRPLA
jgi:hypothetical protein